MLLSSALSQLQIHFVAQLLLLLTPRIFFLEKRPNKLTNIHSHPDKIIVSINHSQSNWGRKFPQWFSQKCHDPGSILQPSDERASTFDLAIASSQTDPRQR